MRFLHRGSNLFHWYCMLGHSHFERGLTMRDIVGYEGLYSVTSTGEVYSHKSQKFLKPQLSSGYLTVTLYINSKYKSYLIHRLVAEAFIPNPENLPQVNHKDEDKTNNDVSNLEYCDVKYNMNYGTRKQKIAKALHKPVLCVELNQIFPSVKDAAKHFNVTSSNICYVLSGRNKTACGYHWAYA